MEETILLEKTGGVLWISLNRPDKLNSMTLDMHKAICEALDDAELDESIGSIVITGVGRAFCAGADISEVKKLTPLEAKKYSEKGHDTMKKIMNHSKPVIAAVNGYALGGGCELASACDFRIASYKAKFGQPEIDLGIIPGWGGTRLLADIVGKTKAKELLLTGTTITADEALALGLVSKIVKIDMLKDEANALATTLNSASRLVLKALKGLLNLECSVEEAFQAEGHAFSSLFETEKETK